MCSCNVKAVSCVYFFVAQFDTLPIAYSDPSKMEAGDLVFISGTYNNPKGITTSQRQTCLFLAHFLGS